MKKLLWMAMLASGIWAGPSWATNQNALPLQQEWEQIKYKKPVSQREMAFEKLMLKAQKSAEAHPEDSEVMVWQAIILSATDFHRHHLLKGLFVFGSNFS